MHSILKLFWSFQRLLYLNSLASLCISVSIWKLWALANTSKNETTCLGILILGFCGFLPFINLVFLGTKVFIWWTEAACCWMSLLQCWIHEESCSLYEFSPVMTSVKYPVQIRDKDLYSDTYFAKYGPCNDRELQHVTLYVETRQVFGMWPKVSFHPRCPMGVPFFSQILAHICKLPAIKTLWQSKIFCCFPSLHLKTPMQWGGNISSR